MSCRRLRRRATAVMRILADCYGLLWLHRNTKTEPLYEPIRKPLNLKLSAHCHQFVGEVAHSENIQLADGVLVGDQINVNSCPFTHFRSNRITVYNLQGVNVVDTIPILQSAHRSA